MLVTKPDFDMYPDEGLKVAQLLSRLGNQFDFSHGKYGPDESDRRIFEAAVHSEFDKIGIKVRVNWNSCATPMAPPSPGGVREWSPMGAPRRSPRLTMRELNGGLCGVLPMARPGMSEKTAVSTKSPSRRPSTER